MRISWDEFPGRGHPDGDRNSSQRDSDHVRPPRHDQPARSVRLRHGPAHDRTTPQSGLAFAAQFIVETDALRVSQRINDVSTDFPVDPDSEPRPRAGVPVDWRHGHRRLAVPARCHASRSSPTLHGPMPVRRRRSHLRDHVLPGNTPAGRPALGILMSARRCDAAQLVLLRAAGASRLRQPDSRTGLRWLDFSQPTGPELLATLPDRRIRELTVDSLRMSTGSRRSSASTSRHSRAR